MSAKSVEAGSMTRKERERATRRQEIIAAAEQLFAAQGFENTTMEEIAEKAEFGKPTLYSYFKSKDEILFRIHMRKHEAKMETFRQAIRQHATGYARLRALGVAYYRFYRDNPEYLRMQVYWDYKGLDLDKLNEPVREQYRELEDTFVELSRTLRLGAADGSLRDDLDVGRTMDLFFMTLRAVLNQVLLVVPPRVSQIDDNSEGTYLYYLDLFMDALRARL